MYTHFLVQVYNIASIPLPKKIRTLQVFPIASSVKLNKRVRIKEEKTLVMNHFVYNFCPPL